MREGEYGKGSEAAREGSPPGGFWWNFSLRLLIAPAIALVVRLWCLTLRFRHINREGERELLGSGRAFILAFWHGRMFPLPYIYRRPFGYILVSRSRDGELVGQVLKHFNSDLVRGSTTSPGGRDKGGGRALRELVSLMRKGHSAGITTDGPKGPRHRVQMGIITLAALTGAPIVPVTFGARHARRFGSWDRFLLPYPFSETVVIWGDPLEVPEHADSHLLEKKRQELEQSLLRITEQADNFFYSPE